MLNQFKGKRGQSTVEYIVLVTAVISIAVVFLMGTDLANSPFKKKVFVSMNVVTDNLAAKSTTLADSRPASNKSGDASVFKTDPGGNCEGDIDPVTGICPKVTKK